MATLNYDCPACGGPLKFNPDKQKFTCEYCLSEFDPKTVQEMYAQQEKKVDSEEIEEQEAQAHSSEDGEAVIYTCPTCGAEVMTSATTAATHCFYCHNPIVLGGRLSGEYTPDKVLPFVLTKEKAIDKFLAMCKKRHFLPAGFASKERFEKFSGVYFPYWYVDQQKQAALTATCKKVRRWRSGNTEYTETSIYNVSRAGDLIIRNVAESALGNDDDAEVIENGIAAYSEAYEQKCERADYFKKLVDKDGRFLAGVIADADKGAYGFVHALFVEAPLRRQGLGTYLLREAEKLAKESDAPMVLTTAGDWNVGFFQKNGYLLRGELKDVPKGHDCYELYKMI